MRLHRSILLAGLVFLAACGSDADQAESQGAGRAIPTDISDLQADCERGTPGTCEALAEQVGDSPSGDALDELLCGSWGDLQLTESDNGAAAERIVTLAGGDLPDAVAQALSTMATATGPEMDDARDVVDEYFLERC
ncbi:MAG: hypothetical protein OES57_08170 [Acidimicrobiia bacterium]|nr:hypothetical protein [Acidimicrobiia bacterium]